MFIRLGAIVAMAFVGGACDDAGPGGVPMGGSGGTGGMAGEGGGGEGGEMNLPPCVRDNLCEDNQYCDRPAEGGIGQCREGCRSEPDNCPGNETCDVMTRMCGFLCAGDDDCVNPEEYCDADGACVPGCRSTEASCGETDERGRTRVCDDESRECVSLFPCCSADGCSDLLPDACSASGGTVLNGASSCTTNPCGDACESDADCGDDLNRYCNTEDGRCADGCRLSTPGSCPPELTCDELKRTCEEVRCFDDEDCPDYQICDPDTNLCRDGCRDDSVCSDGERCIENVCQQVCDPEDPTACGDGRYCDRDALRCEDDCGSHDDCADPTRFCNAESECELGCRDDEGDGGEPNDDVDGAVAVVLGAANENLVRFGSVDGRIICGNDRDVYAVEVGPFERIRVDVHFDRAEGNLDMELDGEFVEDGPLLADSVDVPERIEFPDPDSDDVVQDGTTYYITVFGNGSDLARRLDYRVEVSTVDARSGCFPDPRDLMEPGDNSTDNATVVPERGAEYLSNICADDVDFFVIGLQPNDGLQIELRPDANLEVRGYLYADGQPPGPAVLTEATNYQYAAEVGDSAFAPAGDWYIRVEGTNGTVGEYGLTIRRFSSAACGTDGGTEPNGDIDNAIRIEAPVIPDGMDLPAQDLELAICTEGRPDVDMFCFDVNEGDILEAAVETAEGIDGTLDIQFVNAGGVFIGQRANSGQAGEEHNIASVLQTVDGTYCIRVSGVEGAQGAYTLFAGRREAPMGMCALDRDEGPRRNDTANTAVELMSMAEDALSYQHNSYICDPEDSADEDWFSFNVPEERSNVCVSLDRFNGEANDVDVSIYRNVAVPGGQGCNNSAECDELDAGSACVRGRCAAPVGDDIGGGYDFAMVHLSRDRIGGNSGEYLVRVTHRDANEGPYTVNADVNTNNDECTDDIREPNNDDQRATALGSGDVAICNSWICDGRPEDEDWYVFEVPANQDRTVMVSFGSSEGRLYTALEGPALPGEDLSGQIVGEIDGNGADPNQCVNIRGGADNATISLRVHARSIDGSRGNNRVDYSLRVVPTDLSDNLTGECQRLGGNARTCDPRDEWDEIPGLGRIQPLDCWPTMVLP